MKGSSSLLSDMSLVMKSAPVMISACLLGVRCRYDGGHSLCPGLISALDSIHIVPFCPEQLGGLPTPRSPANITHGDGSDVLQGSARIIDAQGMDVTRPFKKGAEEALKLARLTRASVAVMKDRSPSCGIVTPYCENEKGMGPGVTAALFQQSGMEILEQGSESTFPVEKFYRMLEAIYPNLR